MELKPCPFCGREPILNVYHNNSIYGDYEAEIGCTYCDVYFYDHESSTEEMAKDALVKQWNTRYEAPNNNINKCELNGDEKAIDMLCDLDAWRA